MLAGVNPNLIEGQNSEKRAVYVTTGGPVPEGFVAVVPIEEVIIVDDGNYLDLRLTD